MSLDTSSARVFGIAFSSLTEEQLLHRLLTEPVPPGSGPRVLVTTNLDHVVQLARDPAFKAAYDRAWLATADGMPVYRYARWRGAAAPQRVTGADLFAALMRRVRPDRHRCFFIASNAATARSLAAFLVGRGFAPDAVASDVPPFGFDRDPAYTATLAARIRDHGTTHLILGVGAPKSEVWVNENRAQLPDCYALGVGAALEFFVGAKSRAPAVVQRAGLEWFWRFLQEPRRLFRRYFVDSWRFLGAVRMDLDDAARRRAP